MNDEKGTTERTYENYVLSTHKTDRAPTYCTYSTTGNRFTLSISTFYVVQCIKKLVVRSTVLRTTHGGHNIERARFVRPLHCACG